MRFALPKNRVAPLIIFAIFSILVSLILGIYHINRMAQFSYQTKLETCNTFTENVAVLLKQDIENNYQSIQVSANLVAKLGQLDKDSIVDVLPLLAEDNSYLDLAIVGLEGRGYNLAGDLVDISGELYFEDAKQGQINNSNSISYMFDNRPVIALAAPIIDEGVTKGVLVAKVEAQIDNPAIFSNELEESSLIYLLNENKEIVAYVKGSDNLNFNYEEILANGNFYEDQQKAMKEVDLRDFFVKGKELEETFIWNQKSLDINNWSVLIGRNYALNPSTKDILSLTNIMWAIITMSTFVLFLIMTILQRRANRKVIKMLYLDPVTGGENWYKFRINVNKILNSKQFGKKRYALVNFDINRFKIINDAYGYQKGDEVLKDIYHVIKKWTRPGDPITRYAADQFYILMSFQEENDLLERINDLNERLHQLQFTKTARIFYGVYYITERQDSIDRMGEFAGIAKSNIKGNTEGIIAFFDEIDKGRLLEEEEIEKSMNEALKNEEFHVFLQPKYDVKEETISGAEALVRWFHGSATFLSPNYFIPVFEKNGFITELDYYMLKKVCELIKDWLEKGYTPLPISVNISRLNFVNSHLAEIINEIVDNYGVPHELIELELTESAFLQNKQILIETVIRLREYGFLVSMDDFGAGYSSLNSLKDLPLDVVKLDGELFRMTDEVERGLTVIRNTITMAKDLHMKVVAECIETREQVDFLCNVGCDIIQGYYFAKPMPADQFERRYISFLGVD